MLGNNKKYIFWTACFLVVLFFANETLAHSGRTDSSGGHNCNVGSCAGTYHYHNGGSSYTPPAPKVYIPPPASTCPSNSTGDGINCDCNEEYASSLDEKSCIKLPVNALRALSGNTTDIWVCDNGYREEGNECIPIDDCGIDNYETTISRVVDGDTIEFECNGDKEKIRIIGIDTPETVHPSKPVECFGKEASEKINELVQDKVVKLQKDLGTDDRDKYDRLLRYIEIDGEDIGAKMIKNGYAFSYKAYPHKKLDEYNNFEKEAREGDTGLWSKDKCEYQEDEEIVAEENEPNQEEVSEEVNQHVEGASDESNDTPLPNSDSKNGSDNSSDGAGRGFALGMTTTALGIWGYKKYKK
jgi:endonuclease YncB( thermonuclease family)